MEYVLNHNNEFTASKTGKDLYYTNQFCNRCAYYKNNRCEGIETGLFKPCVNKYCPHFKDRNYTQEQTKKQQTYLDWIKNKSLH